MDKDNQAYADIIYLPHHVSRTRPQMPMSDRAAQFSPFAALTGYDDAIQETRRLTERRIQIDEDVLNVLNLKFQILLTHIQEHPFIKFTYFKADAQKSGGSYITVDGSVKKILEAENQIILLDGTKIPIADIIALDSHIFYSIEE